MLIILGMYLFTLTILIVTGIICMKHHSPYPNTDIGFHVSWATENEYTWNSANKVVGFLMIVLSIIPFGVFPIIFYLANLNLKIQILFYFIELSAYIGLILLLPKKYLQTKIS